MGKGEREKESGGRWKEEKEKVREGGKNRKKEGKFRHESIRWPRKYLFLSFSYLAKESFFFITHERLILRATRGFSLPETLTFYCCFFWDHCQRKRLSRDD